MDEAATAMDAGVRALDVRAPEHEQAAREMVRTGGGVFSHPVGMAVHDDGGRPNPLRAGQVFSVDPQLWIKDAGGQNLLYMRYEDVGVVTDDGIRELHRLHADDARGARTHRAAERHRPGLSAERDAVEAFWRALDRSARLLPMIIRRFAIGMPPQATRGAAGGPDVSKADALQF